MEDQLSYAGIVQEVNDKYLKIAKIKSREVAWHNHNNEDELFCILEGTP